MKFVDSVTKKDVMTLQEMTSENMTGRIVSANGTIHSLKDMGCFSFVLLRNRDGLLQCVADNRCRLPSLKTGQALTVTGELREEPRAPHGIELLLPELLFFPNRQNSRLFQLRRNVCPVLLKQSLITVPLLSVT